MSSLAVKHGTARYDRVRDTHARIAGTTLPANDPFWDHYYPPNRWRCRCTAVQVLKEKYPVDNSAEKIRIADTATTQIDSKGRDRGAMFRYNPGKQQVIFPPNHPYRKVQDMLKDIIKGLSDHAGWEKIETKDGTVRISPDHGIEERDDNIATAKYLAEKHGYEINLLPIKSGSVSVDSYNVTLKKFQEYKRNEKPTKSAIDNEIRDAAKQADDIVIRIDSDISNSDLQRGIKGHVNQAKNVKSITIIRANNDKTYSREEIMLPNFTL